MKLVRKRKHWVRLRGGGAGAAGTHTSSPWTGAADTTSPHPCRLQRQEASTEVRGRSRCLSLRVRTQEMQLLPVYKRLNTNFRRISEQFSTIICCLHKYHLKHNKLQNIKKTMRCGVQLHSLQGSDASWEFGWVHPFIGDLKRRRRRMDFRWTRTASGSVRHEEESAHPRALTTHTHTRLSKSIIRQTAAMKRKKEHWFAGLVAAEQRFSQTGAVHQTVPCSRSY